MNVIHNINEMDARIQGGMHEMGNLTLVLYSTMVIIRQIITRELQHKTSLVKGYYEEYRSA